MEEPLSDDEQRKLEFLIPDELRGHLGYELQQACILAAEKFPRDFEAFFKRESEPIERRRQAFTNLFGFIWPKFEAKCDEPLSPDLQREWLVITGLMSFVPADQWSQDDVQRLLDELLPIDTSLAAPDFQSGPIAP